MHPKLGGGAIFIAALPLYSCCSTVFEKGWNTLQNGDLPRTAEREGVEDLGNDGPESKRSTEPEGAADCCCRARDNELTYDQEKSEPSRRRYRFNKAGRLLR